MKLLVTVQAMTSRVVFVPDEIWERYQTHPDDEENADKLNEVVSLATNGFVDWADWEYQDEWWDPIVPDPDSDRSSGGAVPDGA